MWSGIVLFYLACTILGFLFAIVSVIFGELSGHGGIGGLGGDVGGHELSIGHDIAPSGGVDVGHELGAGGHAGVEHFDSGHTPGASFFNGLTITTLIAFFGLSGLFSTFVLGLGTLPSLAFALPVSLIIAVAQFALYVKVFIRAQGSSEATLFETLGSEADVITAIPGTRVGEIAYVIKGCRYTAPAVSADNDDIPRGTRVRVVNLRGTTYVVRPI